MDLRLYQMPSMITLNAVRSVLGFGVILHLSAIYIILICSETQHLMLCLCPGMFRPVPFIEDTTVSSSAILVLFGQTESELGAFV